jgi:hypothetical protein
LEIVAGKEMLFDSVQHTAIRVDKAAAYITLQMEMFPALAVIVYVLITGACTPVQHVFADIPLGRQFFEVPVDGGLPYKRSRVLKMTPYLSGCYMAAPKGLHVIKNTLTLAGAVIRRTFIPHSIGRIPD